MSEYRFEDLPGVVATLVEEIKGLRLAMDKHFSADAVQPKDSWMTMTEFREFHPEHPAAPTVYGWIRRGLLPHYKKGKKLFFKRSEIEDWLNDARQLTDAEYEQEAVAYINNKRTRR